MKSVIFLLMAVTMAIATPLPLDEAPVEVEVQHRSEAAEVEQPQEAKIDLPDKTEISFTLSKLEALIAEIVQREVNKTLQGLSNLGQHLNQGANKVVHHGDPVEDDEAFLDLKEDQKQEEKLEEQPKPMLFLPRRPEYYNPYPFYYNPYRPSYFPYDKQYPGVPHPRGPQFRRDPTNDEGLSDIEALNQLEHMLLLQQQQERSMGYEGEGRGLMSSLSSGANVVRSGVKSAYSQAYAGITANLPKLVYKTLVVPSLSFSG